MRADTSKIRGCFPALSAAAALALLGASMAPARAADDAAGVVVRYTGQDLASDANAQRLLRRIEVAAHDACGDRRIEPLVMQTAAQRCYRIAVAHAVASVNAARVSAAYVAQYGTQAPADEARAQAVSVRHPG